MAEHYVNAPASVATPMELTVDEVKRETAKDATLQVVIELVQTNKWHNIAHYRDTEVSYECLLSFSKVRDTLTVNESADLLMRDYQIVIPNTLRKRVVELAHEGHQGMSKTKALIRTNVWFPGIDAAVEEAVKRCIPCQANSTRRETQPIAVSTLPRSMAGTQYRLLRPSAYGRVPVGDHG